MKLTEVEHVDCDWIDSDKFEIKNAIFNV